MIHVLFLWADDCKTDIRIHRGIFVANQKSTQSAQGKKISYNKIGNFKQMSDQERQRLVDDTEGPSMDDGRQTDPETPTTNGGDTSEGREQLLFEDVPVYTTCPFCKEKIVTRTSFKRGKYTYWTSVCLCIFQCYCCVWIPFILDGLKNVVHTCPQCGTKLAEYSRLRVDRIWKKKKKHRQAQHNYSTSAR